MSTITVTRDDRGQLIGAGEKDKKAYAAFKKRVDELQPGELYQLTVWFPRNQKLHGLHFALLTTIYDNQEQFSDLEQLRAWLQVGAGHCEFVPGPKGRMVALPKSISFRAMDDAEFQAHHEAVKDFLRSPYATQFLWGHLSEPEQAAMVDTILSQFEQPA